MNKKLRRLLIGGQRNRQDANNSKNKRSKATLPSLLSPRSTATPNPYFRSNSRADGSKVIEEKYEKELNGNELIVNTDHKEAQEIKVTLEPMRDDVIRIQEAGKDLSSPPETRVPESRENVTEKLCNGAAREEPPLDDTKTSNDRRHLLHNNRPRAAPEEKRSAGDIGASPSSPRPVKLFPSRGDSRPGPASSRQHCAPLQQQCRNSSTACDVTAPPRCACAGHAKTAARPERSQLARSGHGSHECDWGWVSIQQHEAPPTADHVTRSDDVCGACGHDVTHERAFEHVRCGCHGGSDFCSSMTSQRCAMTCHTRHRHTHCKCRAAPSPHCCGASPCTRPPRVCPGCSTTLAASRSQSSFSRSSVSFTISGEDGDQPRVLEFPTHHTPCNHHHHHDHCCQPPTDCCDSLAMRARKRHLEDVDCSATFGGLSDCHKHCCISFDPHQRNHLRELTMPPSVAFMTQAEEASVSVSRQQARCCCTGAPTVPNRSRGFARAAPNPNPKADYPSSDQYACSGPVQPERAAPAEPLGHFHLSPQAYAKLIAYCNSKELLLGMYTNGLEKSDFRLPTSGRLSPNAEIAAFDSRRSALPSPAYVNEATKELCRLASVFETVEECPWYWGGISGQEARKILRGTAVGTFLLRESSDPRHLFSLSLMTRRGATSIRIVDSNGSFRFDSDRDDVTNNVRQSQPLPPRAARAEQRQCVVRMVLNAADFLKGSKVAGSNPASESNSLHSGSNRLTNSTATPSGRGDEAGLATGGGTAPDGGQFMCSWMDRGDRREISVVLAHPHNRNLHSLQHLCRIALNKHSQLWKNQNKIQNLPLPGPLKNYIRKYPYPV